MRKLVLAVAALACFAQPAAARDFEVAVQGRVLSMQLAGHLVSVPGPLWVGPGETVDVERSQVVYKQVAPGVESVMFLPLEETLVTWTRMMGILAVERPGYIAAYQTASMVEPMLQDCTPAQTIVSKLPAIAAGGQEGLLLMCGRYRPTRSGPRNCPGGILVAVALQSDRGAMKAYQEWCTGAFDVGDRASWPISGDELQVRASELQQATRFVPLTPAAASPN